MHFSRPKRTENNHWIFWKQWDLIFSLSTVLVEFDLFKESRKFCDEITELTIIVLVWKDRLDQCLTEAVPSRSILISYSTFEYQIQRFSTNLPYNFTKEDICTEEFFLLFLNSSLEFR